MSAKAAIRQRSAFCRKLPGLILIVDPLAYPSLVQSESQERKAKSEERSSRPPTPAFSRFCLQLSRAQDFADHSRNGTIVFKILRGPRGRGIALRPAARGNRYSPFAGPRSEGAKPSPTTPLRSRGSPRIHAGRDAAFIRTRFSAGNFPGALETARAKAPDFGKASIP